MYVNKLDFILTYGDRSCVGSDETYIAYLLGGPDGDLDVVG